MNKMTKKILKEFGKSLMESDILLESFVLDKIFPISSTFEELASKGYDKEKIEKLRNHLKKYENSIKDFKINYGIEFKEILEKNKRLFTKINGYLEYLNTNLN